MNVMQVAAIAAYSISLITSALSLNCCQLQQIIVPNDGRFSGVYGTGRLMNLKPLIVSDNVLVGIDEGKNNSIDIVRLNFIDSLKESKNHTFKIIANPKNCVIRWIEDLDYNSDPMSDNVKVNENLVFARQNQTADPTKYGFVKTRHDDVENTTNELIFKKDFEVMAVDCKASARLHLKQTVVEYGEPLPDISKIEKSATKSVKFFYTSTFINDSPNIYSETFSYSEGKDISMTLSSSAMQQSMQSSEWMSTYFSSSEWHAGGSVTVGASFKFFGSGVDTSATVSGGYSHNSGSDQSKSGSSSNTISHEKTSSNSASTTINIEKAGNIFLDPFTEATITATHYDIKNATAENEIFIRIESTQPGYSKQDIADILKRTKIGGPLEIVTDRDDQYVYLSFKVDIRIDMGLHNVIKIEGGLITESERFENVTTVLDIDRHKGDEPSNTFKVVTIFIASMTVIVAVAVSFIIGFLTSQYRMRMKTDAKNEDRETSRPSVFQKFSQQLLQGNQ